MRETGSKIEVEVQKERLSDCLNNIFEGRFYYSTEKRGLSWRHLILRSNKPFFAEWSCLARMVVVAFTKWCTMPIVDKLKEALKPGRKDSADDVELGKLLAASAKKILLQKIEFEPASKNFSYQLETLKSKYVLLNPRTENCSRHKSSEEGPIRKQGARLVCCTCLLENEFFICFWVADFSFFFFW